VRASDKRAQFVGIDAYETTGGDVMWDLFPAARRRLAADPMLLDLLVAAKLEREAHAVRFEGWKSLEAAIDFLTATLTVAITFARSLSASK
jgi:ParB family transcriptional regulator, chromosome partitioning protein